MARRVECVRVDEKGGIQIPEEFLEELSLRDGDAVVLNLVNDTLHLVPVRDGLSQARKILAPYLDGPSMAEELLAERRAEADD